MTQLQKLSDAVGIPRTEIPSIWGAVKANHAKLEACTRHSFGLPDGRKIGFKYVCQHCGGVVDGVEALWYERGLKHGCV